MYQYGERECPKCGSGERVGDGVNAVTYHKTGCRKGEDVEHLHYTCNRCKFTWMTFTRDYVQPDEPVDDDESVDDSAAA